MTCVLGNGKYQFHVLWITGISTMVAFIEGNSMAYVLPAAKCDLNITISQQGFTYIATTFGFAFSSFFWGFLGDTWGRRKVLQTELIICFLLAIISSFSITSWMLMFTRFLMGLRLSVKLLFLHIIPIFTSFLVWVVFWVLALHILENFTPILIAPNTFHCCLHFKLLHA